ncbi:hypothetical protein RJ639_006330, partial [Escallonia herrerae]
MMSDSDYRWRGLQKFKTLSGRSDMDHIHMVIWTQKRDARKDRSTTYSKSIDSYDTEDFVMPLHQYINDPIALDVIHNGATFQVAGLTNNSYIAESHDVRHCVLKYQNLGEYVLEVAKKRLDDMLYVGLTENHRESATMFANVVGAQVISQLVASSKSSLLATNIKSGLFTLSMRACNKQHCNHIIDCLSSSIPDSESDTYNHQNGSTLRNASDVPSGGIEATNKTWLSAPLPADQMTLEKLMEAYETCISSLRKSQAQRRTTSLKRISPVNFMGEARRRVPQVVLQEITKLNILDMELYKHAQDIFARQQSRMVQKLVGPCYGGDQRKIEDDGGVVAGGDASILPDLVRS